MDHLEWRSMQGANIRDGGPTLRISKFLERWAEANRGAPEPAQADEGALHKGLKELLGRYEAEASKT